MTIEEIFNVLKEYVVEIIGIDKNEVVMDRSLKELGANSIDRMDIIVETMEELEIKIPLAKFGKAKNINDIVDILYAEKAGG